MKIALLTDGIYPYVMGGMQKHSYYLAKYLAQREVVVDLYHCVPFNEELPTGLKGFTEKEMQFIHHHVIHFPIPAAYPGHYAVESYRFSKQLFKLLLEQAKPDLIYAQGFSGWYMINHKNKLVNIPVVVNFHGLEMFQNAPSFKVRLEHLILIPAIRVNLKRADFVVSLGGKLKAILKKCNNSVLELPIGIEESWLLTKKTNNPNLKFVFIGRYERRKGIEELNQAIVSLSADLTFEFHFIGPIEPNQQIKDSHVIYHGAIREQEKVKALLEQMDVLVVPSWSEGMPTVILEAMACGCAILATNVGAVSVLVDKQNGWLIEPGSVHQLTKQLNTILEMDRKLLKEKQQQSLLKIQTFTWENIINEHIRTFKAIIQKSNLTLQCEDAAVRPRQSPE